MKMAKNNRKKRDKKAGATAESTNGDGGAEETQSESTSNKRTRKVQKFSDSLRVDLTKDEVADRADRAAHMVTKIRDKKEEIKTERQKQAKELSVLEAEHVRLTNEVLSRSSYKSVVCTRTFDFATKMVTEVRTDTGEILGDRPMTDDELQVDFEFEGDVEDEFGGEDESEGATSSDEEGDGNQTSGDDETEEAA
jgi:hypothetical protein